MRILLQAFNKIQPLEDWLNPTIAIFGFIELASCGQSIQVSQHSTAKGMVNHTRGSG